MTTNTLNRIKSAAEELGVAHPYRYMNYAMASQADEIFAGYGDGNAQRLREIQRAVDPSGVFTSQGLWRGFIKLLLRSTSSAIRQLLGRSIRQHLFSGIVRQSICWL